MNEHLLKEKYMEIEKRIYPIVDYLEDKKNSKELKDVYKGIITLQSPLIYKPMILFVGLNPGDGAYKVLNFKKSDKNITPLRMIGKDERGFKELNWYEKGNARGCFVGDKWVSYEWYQRNEKVNNVFTKRMIDLLYKIAELKFPQKYKSEKWNNNSKPSWYESFGRKVMFTNLYPIATSNMRDLYKILNFLAKEDSLKQYWENGESINNWNVRLFFVKLAHDLVKLTNPKVVVCLGKSAFNDFTYTNVKSDKKIYEGDGNVIGFSRRGNWSVLLDDLAIMIIKKQSKLANVNENLRKEKR